MLRRIVPALGVIALLPLSANAQEIAKGVDLSGYVDSYFVGETNNVDGMASTTDFNVEGVIKLGWAITDRASATIATRTGAMQTSGGTLNVPVAYGTVKATDKVTVSFGKSYGPFGYYSPWATGLSTVTSSLTTGLYTVNPIGVWADCTVSDQLTISAILADGYSADKAGKPGNVSPGVDVVFKAMPELSINVEGYLDPTGGVANADGSNPVYFGGLNAEYKKDAITAAGEFLYQTVGGNGATTDDDQSNMTWSAFVNYNLGTQTVPMSVTGQVSSISRGETGALEDDTSTKFQAALLTNPIGSADFGLNVEGYLVMNDEANNASGDSESTYGVAIEGLYVLP